jgi:hypothetical protein
MANEDTVSPKGIQILSPTTNSPQVHTSSPQIMSTNLPQVFNSSLSILKTLN